MKKITLLLMTLIVFQLNAQTYTGSNTTTTAFVDNEAVTGVSLNIPISGVPTAGIAISDIEIDLAINHTWVGDIGLVLTSPTNKSIVLRPDVTGAGDSSDMVSTSPVTFTDAATVNAVDMGITIAGGFVCLTDGECSFKPDDGTYTFANFITDLGTDDPNGDWVLTGFDYAGGDLGDFAVNELRIVTTVLSVDENELAPRFTMFPNPVQNELVLKAQNNIQDVGIYNILGQKVKRTEPNALQTTLNMGDLPAGAYFVKVTINGIAASKRIIKE
jgi:subtilisin-like proprotein convertase family protein